MPASQTFVPVTLSRSPLSLGAWLILQTPGDCCLKHEDLRDGVDNFFFFYELPWKQIIYSRSPEHVSLLWWLLQVMGVFYVRRKWRLRWPLDNWRWRKAFCLIDVLFCFVVFCACLWEFKFRVSFIVPGNVGWGSLYFNSCFCLTWFLDDKIMK